MYTKSFALGAIAIALAATTAEANPKVGGAAMFASKNIIENAVKSPAHTTLVAAVKAAGLVDALQADGPFTVFAPTNSAFAKLPAGTVETLVKPENKETLTKILTCHVVPALAVSRAASKMIMDDGGSHKVKTLGGCELTLTMKGPYLMVSDENGGEAKVTIADVMQSNGVIHVINRVLLPKS